MTPPKTKPPVSRKEAKSRGLNRYFTGKPCKHGHISERYTYGGCVQCTLAARRSYDETHPEQRRKRRKSYRDKNKEKERERKKRREKRNVATTKARYRRRYERRKMTPGYRAKENERNRRWYVAKMAMLEFVQEQLGAEFVKKMKAFVKERLEAEK